MLDTAYSWLLSRFFPNLWAERVLRKLDNITAELVETKELVDAINE